MRFVNVLVLACLAPLVAGCPRHARHTLVPSVPETGDARARQRFEEARARFERDGTGGDEMTAIVRDYPDDPIAPYARLYAGVAQVGKGDYAAAAAGLAKVDADDTIDAGLRTRAALFEGIADAYLGKAPEALPLLARGAPAVENDGERAEWTAATAVATAGGAHPLEALPWFDRYWQVARPAERGFILARLEEVVAAAPDDQILAAWNALEAKDGPAAAVLGPRAVAAWEQRGEAQTDAPRARAIANAARKNVGLPPLAGATEATTAEPDGATAGLVGAALPMTGKQERLGEAAMHGLAVAAGALGGPAAVNVEVRDAPGKDAAAAAIDALADAGAIAVVGPVDGDSVDAAATRAAARGVALLSLNPRADERARGAPLVFHVVHSAEARARTLARRAAAAGVKKVAVFAPDSGYGKAVAAAFVDAYGAAGGAIAKRVDYKSGTRSFADEVGKLGDGWDAVFVPDTAEALGLIAPALDAAGMIPRKLGTRKVKGGRPILVLATAEGAGPELITAAGRHLYGAWLAPGFYPEAQDPIISDYVARFLAAYGKAPTALDAYAYDAALVIARAAATSRAQLAAALAAGAPPGVTGVVRFDADHRRADDGVLFVVEDDGAGGARVKASR